jgi:hypothetical protein
MNTNEGKAFERLAVVGIPDRIEAMEESGFRPIHSCPFVFIRG